jgi:predicted TPR repeat methyltransferase
MMVNSDFSPDSNDPQSALNGSAAEEHAVNKRLDQRATAPANQESTLQLASLLITAGQIDEAITVLGRAAHHSKESKLPLQLASLYLLNNQPQFALETLRPWIDELPNDPLTRQLVYRSIVDAQQFDAAILYLERWLALVPEDDLTRYLRGFVQDTPTPHRAPEAYVLNTYQTAAAFYDSFLKLQMYRGPELFSQLLSDCFRGTENSTQKEDNDASTRIQQDEAHNRTEGEGSNQEVTGVQSKTRRVLDLGCGTGILGSTLRPFADELQGVDLSPAMLAIAERTGNYNQLHCADLMNFLQSTHPDQPHSHFDLIVAAESFIYFGDLSKLIPLCFDNLKQEGWLVFSLQEGPLTEDGYYLLPSGNFMHSPQYVIEQLGEAGVAGGNIRRAMMRNANNQNGYTLLIAVQRPNARFSS